jgi:hypothetical protein
MEFAGRTYGMKPQWLQNEVLHTTDIFKGTHRPVIYMSLSKFRTCVTSSENYAGSKQNCTKLENDNFHNTEQGDFQSTVPGYSY